jgi:diguanylate cyclase (GGDEF)-like protein
MKKQKVMSIENFIYSGFVFGEDEDLLKYKFRMINSILVIVAFFAALVGLLSDLGINDIGPIHSKVNYVYSLLTITLIFFLRSSRENYTTTANLLLIVSLLSFMSCLIFVPQDEFRMIWFFLLVFVAYMLNGTISGVLFTAASIGVILITHFLIDLHLSQVAINSAVLGLVIGSFLAETYTKKITGYERRLQKKNAELKVLASTDDLTGIMNKRIFQEVSKRYFKTAQRDRDSLTLLLFDLDLFKEVNDTYGHQVGDKLLIRFVEILESFLRKSDILARVGGEEFALLLFNTDFEGAYALAEKIREEVKHHPFTYDRHNISMTTSIGATQLRESDASFDEIFARADKALYQAKADGRNKTRLIS